MEEKQEIPDNLGDLRESIQAAQKALGSQAEAEVPEAMPLAPTFYSRLEKAISGLGAKPIQSEAVKNRLKKSGEGFSEEEWQWAGMNEFLGGRKTVTKEELLKHFKEHQVELIEVFKGSNLSASEHQEMMRLEGIRLAGESLTREQRARFMDLTSRKDGTSRYSQYQTPGGENYRELLLMLPSRTKQREEDIKRQIQELPVDENYNEKLEALQEQLFQSLPAENYQSSHWDEENILAHIRFNERTSPSGEKILHIEEIQSDWHQAGREHGYADPNRDERLRAIRSEISSLDVQMSLMKSNEDKLSPKFSELRDRWDTLIKEQGELANQVPDAPFKENWAELAMKRMLRYAAENDYDRITLNPGEQINKVLQSGAGALEGQKQFYDVTLPNIMAKLGKPFGSKIETHTIGGPSEELLSMIGEVEPFYRHHMLGPKQQDKPVDLAAIKDIFNHPEYLGHGYFIQEMYEKFGKEWTENLRDKIAETYNPLQTASLPITPSMEQSVLGKGMPMMQRGGDVPTWTPYGPAGESSSETDSYQERQEPVSSYRSNVSELLQTINEFEDAVGKFMDKIDKNTREEKGGMQQVRSTTFKPKDRFGKPVGGMSYDSVDALAKTAGSER